MESPSITKQAIKLTFVLGILILVSTAILSYMSSKDRINHQGNVQNAYNKIDVIDNIEKEITSAETSRRGYFITNDRQYLSEYYD
jgi:CHASE3 domain sensor protein